MPEWSQRQPAVFIGHGSPTNALDDNRHTRVWSALGRSLARPKAVLVVSAHWYVAGTAVTAMARPKTIHDFYGFAPELYAYEYPAPGEPALAERVRALLSDVAVDLDEGWGLDHGAWSVLAHVYPRADMPVIQLSIDGTKPAPFHLEIGRKLAPLRDEGVLILGSGNVVHNLRVMRRTEAAPPFDWALQFNDVLRERLVARDAQALANPMQFGDAARLSIPTPEHYLPLLYAAGAARDGDAVEVLTDGIELGSISMLSVRFG